MNGDNDTSFSSTSSTLPLHNNSTVATRSSTVSGSSAAGVPSSANLADADCTAQQPPPPSRQPPPPPPRAPTTTQAPAAESSAMDQLRRFGRNAYKLWSEIMTPDQEEEETTRPVLMVNPQHHLRSHSMSSYHTAAELDVSLDNLADAALLHPTGHHPQQDAALAEPLLISSAHAPQHTPLLRSTNALEPLATPMLISTTTTTTTNASTEPLPLPPPPSPLPRRRTSSGTFLSVERRRYFREVIRRAGNYLAYATLLIMLCVVPVIVYNGLSNRRIDNAAFRSAGVMAAGTVVLSFRLVYLHLTHWHMPGVQKYVVRILWMVPLYAVQSWLSLRFRESRIYIDTIRDYYEAYVIASFVYYLIELLGGEAALIQILQAKNDNEATRHLGKHSFPLRLILDDWQLGEDFMLNCKHGVLQYVVFKSMSAFITFVCESVGVYGEGTFTWFSAYPYLCFFQNISVMYALYSLVMLFSAVNEELRYPINWRPLGKFLCIKGVVFFTWWQGVVIYYLKAHGIIDRLGAWSSEEVANGLIDYCVVIEMICFAMAHSYTFTYKEYLPSAIPPEFRSASERSDVVPASSSAAVVVAAPALLAHGTVLPADGGAPAAALPSATAAAVVTTMESPPPTPMGQRTTAYHPPATLDTPMDFRDAFWSSAVPKDTIQDIQRLRIATGTLEAAAALRPRVFSLPRVRTESNNSERSSSASQGGVAAAGIGGEEEDEDPNQQQQQSDQGAAAQQQVGEEKEGDVEDDEDADQLDDETNSLLDDEEGKT